MFVMLSSFSSGSDLLLFDLLRLTSSRWSNSNAFIRPVVLECFLQGKYLQHNNEKVLKVDEL